MKGLILAGGFATRLRPLSCSKPKLLFPVVGIPLIDRMMEWLGRGNVSQVVLAVNHLSDKLRMEVAARKLENRVRLSVEESPLGTGGPLSLAEQLLAGDEPVVVVNGDVASNIDLDGLSRAHNESGADATIALFKVTDARPFGLVTLDSKDHIQRFEEKTAKSEHGGWINAGVYLLNQNVIRMIPKGRPVSLEREIFPGLAERGRLNGWTHDGFWYDIGKVKDYVTANMDLLSKPDFGGRQNGIQSTSGSRIEQPSYLASDCKLASSATVGPRAILSPRVVVEKGAIVRDSIVFEDVLIGEKCRVEGCVIGEATRIGKGAMIEKGSIVAGEVTISDGSVIGPGSMVLH